MTKNRTKYLDYIRVIAAILVIMIHVSGQNFYEVNLDSFEWMIFNIYDSMVRCAVPLFVMISGALFLNPKKKITIEKVYKKYIPRIIIAFIFWSLFYAIIYHVKYDYTIKETIKYFITGHYHLWYLFTIFGLYVITPILRKIVESKDSTKYFLIIAFITTILIPNILSFININELTNSYNNVNLYLTRGYSIYYILGYYLTKKDISKKKRIPIYVSGILSVIATVLLTAILSIKSNSVDIRFYENTSIFVFIEAISLFIFAKYNLNSYPSKKIETIINSISKASFGIYLIHPIIMDCFDWIFSFNTLTFNPILSIPIMTILVFIISYILSKIIGKIPIINKYIV